MSFGATPNGWLSKPFQTIVDELAEELTVKTGKVQPTTPDSAIGQILNTFALQVKDSYDLGQAITDQTRLSKATGVYLDYIAEAVSLYRLPASGSNGDLLFSGEQGAEVPLNFPVKDDLNRTVITFGSAILNRTECHEILVTVNILQASAEYRIVVNGNPYTYTANSSDTKDTILDILAAIINTNGKATAVKGDEGLRVKGLTLDNTLAVSVSSNMLTPEVSTLIPAEAVTEGSLNFPQETLTTLQGVAIGLTKVTNLKDFTRGRLVERDEELRVRIAAQSENAGTATKPALEASLRNTEGVTSALVIENDTMETVNGIPPKAFQCFVSGGEEQDIAETIYNTMPATIGTAGDISRNVIDDNGDVKVVKFSREPLVPAWLRITYTLNSEESFPADGEDLMIEACINKGNSMYKGEDLVGSKFYSALYASTSGMYVTNVEAAVTSSGSDTPTYTNAPIAVAQAQALEFSHDRITFVRT
ncbi:hypothetical protein KUA24_40 [Vibrio phage HNL01]|nr:hypothetical protein KUA24_40 [Vibrio phage HNL01]